MTTNRQGMDIIYHGYYPMFEAYLAALIHVGLAPNPNRLDSYYQLCSSRDSIYGNLIYVGIDENLNRIYAIGCKGFDTTIIKSQDSFRKIYDIGPLAHYIDTKGVESNTPHIIYRIKGHRYLQKTARRLFCYWYSKAYKRIESFVYSERQSLRRER